MKPENNTAEQWWNIAKIANLTRNKEGAESICKWYQSRALTRSRCNSLNAALTETWTKSKEHCSVLNVCFFTGFGLPEEQGQGEDGSAREETHFWSFYQQEKKQNIPMLYVILVTSRNAARVKIFPDSFVSWGYLVSQLVSTVVSQEQ